MATEPSPTRKVTYGIVGLNGLYLSDSEIAGMMSDGATNVIPLLITHQSSRATAWNAVMMELFKSGAIPRIYLWLKGNPATAGHLAKTPEFISSNVKAIFQKKDVHSWPVSVVKERVLVCASFSRRKQS